jgi:hypothetical protein
MIVLPNQVERRICLLADLFPSVDGQVRQWTESPESPSENVYDFY